MKAGWCQHSLSDIAEKVTDGSHNPPKGITQSEYMMLSSKNVFDDDLHFSDPRYLDAEQFKVEDKRTGVVPGDVLLTIVGTIGRCAVVRGVDPKFTLQRSVAVIRPKQSIVNSRFLMYSLIERTDDLNAQARGVAQKGIYLETLRQLAVALPPLPEQQRIVTLLSEAFDGIAIAKANAEKNLQNARAIFESQREVLLSFREDWLEAPLADICEVKHGYAFEGEFFAPEGDYVLLTPGSFFETGGYRERGEKTKFFIGQIPDNYILDAGDLLVAMTEQAAGLLGSPLLVPESNRFLHNQRLGLVTGKPGIPWHNEFFFHVFNLGRVRQEIHASASGVKVRHTSPGKIGVVRVAYPKSVAEQSRVTSQLGDISAECERLEIIYQQKLTALDELKKSLLHRAFNGDL